MSRVVNIAASREDVLARCTRLNLGVTAVEALVSGGTRVVLMNAADAATLGTAFGQKTINGPVTRRTYGVRSR